MNCPNCGLQLLADQRFCRSCGQSLRPTAERQTHFLFWGFIIMLVGVAAGVLGKKLLHNDVITVVGVLIALGGMFLTVYRYLWPSAPQKFDSGHSQLEVLISSQPTNAIRDVRVEYLPSITEGTTQLLKNPVADKSDYAQTGETEVKQEEREKP